VQIKAMIEICSNRNGKLPVELLKSAYYASQSGTIVLVLNDVSAQQVDAVLDPYVAELPRHIPGVRYVRIRDQIAILDAASETKNVFAKFGAKGRLRPLLTRARLPARPLARAADFLGDE
jgi:hypothetical protein